MSQFSGKAPPSSSKTKQSLLSESKVRLFYPFPKIPDVNLTGAEELLNLENT